jgi:hypothetical protein
VKKKPHIPIRFAQILLLPLLIALYPGLPGDEIPPDSSPLPSGTPDIRLPLKDGSLRWAVIGDNGTGQGPEFDVARQMQQYWTKVKFDFVTMDGDNIIRRPVPA